jgi:hypothetical protein
LAKRTKILQSFQRRSRAGIEFIDENGGGAGRALPQAPVDKKD